MGVYLSSPITTKESNDQTYGNITYGVSSMQGWRMAQEDAHNCIPDFDPETNTSFFAVYDGHGGAEVAKYCAQNLPNFVKDVELYKEGKLGECLEEAFLGFDATLTKEEVIQELKEIAGVEDDDEEDDDDEPTGRTETDMLMAEANMPIEELMAKYSAGPPPQTPQIKRLQKDKNASPMLKAKKDTALAATNNTGDVAASLEDKLENGQPDNDNNLNVEKELREAKSQGDSSDTKVKADTDPDNTNNNKTVNTNGIKADQDQKEVDGNDKEDSSGQKTVDADSTTDENHVAKSEIVSSSSSGEVSTTSSDSGVQMSSSSTSSVDAEKPGSSSVDAQPSGSGCSSSSGVEPSGSAVQAGGSGISAGSSGASGSGQGSSKGGKKTIVDEEFDSDDDSSEEDEYMEESDDEDDDDDDDDEDDEEEAGSGFAGVFGRGVATSEEEDHNEEPGSDSGCTAVVALLRDRHLVVANAGDSRCVLCREGKAVDLSVDHKPEDDSERKRIEEAGGKVTSDGRVNGGLNLSRAIGDHWYKRNESKAAKDQMISALPDIEEAMITDKDQFMVIACDGIWNFMSSQEVVDFVSVRLKDPAKLKKPSLICEELFDHCLAPNTMGDGTGCDNMTCIVVLFNRSEASNKRDTSDLDTSASDEKQPEKRPRLEEEEKGTGDVAAT